MFGLVSPRFFPESLFTRRNVERSPESGGSRAWTARHANFSARSELFDACLNQIVLSCRLAQIFLRSSNLTYRKT